MNHTITELLLRSKTDTKAMELLIKRFEPLIMSYSRKKGWKIETEDLESILTIKLIELAKSMTVFNNEAQNVKFIANALRNHFLDIVRKINRLEKIETVPIDLVSESGACDITHTEFYDMIKDLDERKKVIICLKFQDMLSDQEIAKKLNISRQAVHKQLKNIYSELIKCTH